MSAPSLPIFDCPVDNLDANLLWTRWVSRFRNYLVVAGIDLVADPGQDGNRAAHLESKRKIKAHLLHHLGNTTMSLYEPRIEANDDFEAVITKINAIYRPPNDSTHRIMQFRQCKQFAGENIDQYIQRLKEAAKGCNFGNIDGEIASHVALTSTSVELRKAIELTPEVNLDNVLRIGRVVEKYDAQKREFNAPVDAISSRQSSQSSSSTSSFRPFQSRPPQASNIQRSSRPQPSLHQSHYRPQSRPQHRSFQQSSTSTASTCPNCSHPLPHVSRCPASNQLCYHCNRTGHFSRCCRSRPSSSLSSSNYQRQSRQNHVDTIREESLGNSSSHQVDQSPNHMSNEYDYEFCAAVNTSQHSPNGRRYVQGVLHGVLINFLVDTGTTINIIDQDAFYKIRNFVNLRQATTNIFAYNSTQPIDTLGEFVATLQINNRQEEARFIVSNGQFGSILGLNILEKLGVVRILCSLTPQKQFPNVFSDKIGKLKNIQIKLHIDESVKPVQRQHYRVPFGLREKVKQEIDRMLSMDIIEPVHGPTPWVSPIVIVPKPGQLDKIRICVDAREPNQAIRRERHITPTIDDVAHDLNGAKFFSKIDLTAGYHQLELHPESRYITTFSTHIGLFRYKRLNFGINSASEIFQNVIRQLIADIPGTINFSDDILVYATTKEEHDRRVNAVLKRLQDNGATVNPSKSEFAKTELKFFGMSFSGAGISPDQKKIDAIKNAAPPKDAKEVRSLLGLTNYVSRFIKDYASVTEPLWRLTRKDEPWSWTSEHEQALKSLKSALTSDTMAYFTPEFHTEVISDASPVGLGAILAQRSTNDPDSLKIISYASRLLTDTERRYSQIEKEALAAVWSCERFHLYLLGRHFTLVTDNKAVELILRNPKSSPPLRIQRWNLRLGQYNFTVKHASGALNPSDYLSRHPTDDPPNYSPADEYVNFIEVESASSTISTQDLITASNEDEELQTIKSVLNNQSSVDTLPKTIQNVLDQLTISPNGLIFKLDRLVVPKILQYRTVLLAHEGHQGMERTKRLLRSRMWFPEMDKMVKEVVENCHSCQITTKARSPHSPIHLQPLPSGPWDTISVDFYGPILNSVYLVHVQDEFSKFPIVKETKSTSGESVIPILEDIFALFGTPKTVKSDNGPPFNSEAFANFSRHLGFRHQKITPMWPKANGLNERFMQNITKIITAAHESQRPWRQALNDFLKSYRATPHTSTNIAPAELMFRYKPNNVRLLAIDNNNNKNQLKDRLTEQARVNQASQIKKVEEKRNYGAVESQVKIGDHVLVQQPRTHKLMPRFNPNIYKVTGKRGTMVTASRPDHSITRNASHFKVLRSFHRQPQVQQNSSPPPLTPSQLVLLQQLPHVRMPPPIIDNVPQPVIVNNPPPNIVNVPPPVAQPVHNNRPVRTNRQIQRLNIANTNVKAY